MYGIQMSLRPQFIEYRSKVADRSKYPEVPDWIRESVLKKLVAVHEIRHCCVSLLRRGSEVAAIDGLAVQRRGRMRTDIIFRKYREAERGPTGHSNVRPAILQ